MEWMFRSPQNLSVETLFPSAIVLEDQAFEKWLGLNEVLKVYSYEWG